MTNGDITLAALAILIDVLLKQYQCSSLLPFLCAYRLQKL